VSDEQTPPMAEETARRDEIRERIASLRGHAGPGLSTDELLRLTRGRAPGDPFEEGVAEPPRRRFDDVIGCADTTMTTDEIMRLTRGRAPGDPL